MVSDLLQAAGLTGEESVQMGEESLVLKDALMHRLACTVLSKIQIKKFNEFAQSENSRIFLQVANKDALVDYMWGRELIDLFWNFSIRYECRLFRWSPPSMPPRLYSIASSLSAHSEEVHLTVAVVRYDGHGRKRKGVCFSASRSE